MGPFRPVSHRAGVMAGRTAEAPDLADACALEYSGRGALSTVHVAFFSHSIYSGEKQLGFIL